MPSLTPRHTLTFSIWLGYLFFVVYGSLVPLDFRPLSIDQAWTIFQHIPMYKLGVESRADWIANGVLYVPVGFLTAHLLLQKLSAVRRIPLFFFAGLFSIAVAFGVEFAQIFFPPRTVSLNDLFAESIGSIIGLMLAAGYSDWFKILLHAALSTPRRLALHLGEAYLAGYIAFSLFPYDLLLSWPELEQKLHGNNWGLFLVGDPHGRILTVLRLLTETLLTIPFGLFLGARSAPRIATYQQAALLGILLGGFVEIARFFTASGVSQGVSVLTRMVGVYGGLTLWNHRADWSLERMALLARRYALPLSVIYILTLLQINGWFSYRWNGTDYALSRLGDLHFLPFYYHYYTTEAKALYSLASVCLMYLPIGLLTWSYRSTPAKALFYALIATSIVETGKLFLEGIRPDPTNILLGALASWGIVRLSQEFSGERIITSMVETVPLQILQSPPDMPTPKHTPFIEELHRRWVNYAILLASLAYAAYWAATFPTQPVLLGLFLTACGVVIWHRPVLFAAILPAALPVLDLAQWSGRFFLDEFDLLALISLTIGYTRTSPATRKKQPADALFILACATLAISFAISAIRGLTPWEMPDANAFTNYYSTYNALRIGKGALWAFLAIGLLRRMPSEVLDVQRIFTRGMVIGLALTVTFVLWERVAFSGLFNFASTYRVTGPFSSMHTGGAYIECFLAVATPFLVLLVLQTKNWGRKVAGALLLVATTYALMVTYSRNGYSAFVIAVATLLFFAIFNSGQWLKRFLLIAVLTGAMLVVAVPVFTGQFAQSRIASVSSDLEVRQNHWQDALGIRTPDWLTTLFGMGLGRYPESNYLLSGEGHQSGTYQLKKEDGNTYLRLVSGDSIYIEQLVSVKPRQSYILKLDVRAYKPNGGVSTPICEKWLLTSYNCIWDGVKTGKETGIWYHLERKFTDKELSISPWYSQRPIKFSLYNGAPRTMIDIDNIRLETIEGEDLLSNGDFSQDLDHWFFATDSHLQWHIKSLPVSVLFDQGWLGVLALGFFSLLVIYRAASRAWQGDLHAAAALAAFCGFLVVGLFDTLIDAPRFLFLMILLGGFCGLGRSTRHKDLQHA
ncbi:MAG: VanZ family protein [Propionivibrio sp.]|uniref:VanZ family protein n=1 Tax=Propionivibrio sp. TaxID=2212460 RepID=UPI0025F3832F|nr:VanZ family protein [Propionivibrio sp.]MBK8895006.1 VanZ family protein [Propionivibrio sp.]